MAREAVALTGDPSLVVGVDPSVGMMNQARPIGVQLVAGRSEAIPFPDSTFDFLSMGYALRHVSDLGVAFREFHRVLRPRARVLVTLEAAGFVGGKRHIETRALSTFAEYQAAKPA